MVKWSGQFSFGMLRAMAYCPSCAADLAPDATRCESCGAVFGAGSDWKPLAERPAPDPPSAAGRVASIVVKIVLVLASVTALALGGLFAYSERNHGGAGLMALAGIVVIAVALTTRLRWSFLAVCIAVPIGLVTCASNFKWHGG